MSLLNGSKNDKAQVKNLVNSHLDNIYKSKEDIKMIMYKINFQDL